MSLSSLLTFHSYSPWKKVREQWIIKNKPHNLGARVIGQKTTFEKTCKYCPKTKQKVELEYLTS